MGRGRRNSGPEEDGRTARNLRIHDSTGAFCYPSPECRRLGTWPQGPPLDPTAGPAFLQTIGAVGLRTQEMDPISRSVKVGFPGHVFTLFSFFLSLFLFSSLPLPFPLLHLPQLGPSRPRVGLATKPPRLVGLRLVQADPNQISANQGSHLSAPPLVRLLVPGAVSPSPRSTTTIISKQSDIAKSNLSLSASLDQPHVNYPNPSLRAFLPFHPESLSPSLDPTHGIGKRPGT